MRKHNFSCLKYIFNIEQSRTCLYVLDIIGEFGLRIEFIASAYLCKNSHPP